MIERALGSSPLEKMALLADELLSGERVDPKANEIAARLLSELAQYIAPKRKAVEVTGAGGDPLQIGTLQVEVIESRPQKKA